MNWFSKIHGLAGQEYERYLPTAFDSSLTLLEKVNKVIETLNQIVLGVNTVADYVDEHVNTQNEKIKQLRDDFEILKDWLENEGLEERTTQVLNEWFDNGRLAQIINNDVFDMKADKATFEQFVLSITTQLQQTGLSVKTFGAIGDGVVDDTQAFIDGISFLSSIGGGTLIVPSGDYFIQPDVILLKSNVNIKGTGKSRIFTNAGFAYQFMMGNHTENVKNVEISGLEFDQVKEVGRFEPQTNTFPTRMISIYDPKDVYINKNHFNNLFGQHAVLSGYWINSEGNYIKDNRVTCNRFLTGTTEMYDASAIYVDDKYHEISGNIITSIDTGYHWWKVPGAIETHGTTGYVKDNVVMDAYIGLNLCGDPQLTRTNKPHYVIAGNKFEAVHKGVSIWTDDTLRDVENVHIYQNTIMVDVTFTTKGNNAIGFEPYTANGNLRKMIISDNIIVGQDNYNSYDGVKLLSTHEDFSAINLNKLSGFVEDVTIHGNTIVNYGGGILSTGPVTNTATTVKKVYFRNNTITDPLKFPFAGTAFGLYDIGVGNDITITDNTVTFTENTTIPVNIPEVYLLDIGLNVKKLTYLNNKQNEGRVAIGRIKTNDIHNPEFTIDVGMYLRDGQLKTIDVLTTANPTSGTYYIDNVLNYVGVPYNGGYRGKICAVKGTAGSNPSSANKKYSYQFESIGKYKLGDILLFNETIVTIIGKNGIDYYVDTPLPEGTAFSIDYAQPSWYEREKA